MGDLAERVKTFHYWVSLVFAERTGILGFRISRLYSKFAL